MRYLVVGYGNIGHKRAEALDKKFIASVDPDPKVKADFLSYQAVPLDIFDIAVITTPLKPKYPLVEYFLSKGKHVLVEKPLIITKTQAQKLKILAEKNQVIWQTLYNHRFEPNILKLSELIKKGFLGQFYHGKMIYSFGNIKERIGTWRETLYGVLEEIAPHLIDFCLVFFDYQGLDFKTLIARKVESNILDHWIYSTTDSKILIESSSVTWKNIFSLDLYGSDGSLYIEGLNKWGGSKLIVRTRVFPSGTPKEKVYQTNGPDLTWSKDVMFFEKMIKTYQTSFDSDLKISLALAHLALGAKTGKSDSQTKFYQEILKDESL